MDLFILADFYWTDMIWIILAAVFMLLGLLGCIIPVVPGPPLSYFGLLILQLKSNPPFSLKFMLFMAIITIFVTIIDYLVPFWSSKKVGAGKWGVRGAMIGLLFSFFFFPPFSIFIFTMIGAFAGEIMAGKNSILALKASIGVFMGFMFGTILKVVISGYMVYRFFIAVF